MEKFLAEDKTPTVSVVPQSIATSKTGARVNMENAKRVTFMVNVGVGTSTTAHLFILKQHTAGTSGQSHDLEVAHPYYHKLDTATKFTKADVDVDTASYDLHTLMANKKGLVMFEVLAEDLRSDCSWVSIDFGGSGGTQAGGVVALVGHSFKPAYEQIVDYVAP